MTVIPTRHPAPAGPDLSTAAFYRNRFRLSSLLHRRRIVIEDTAETLAEALAGIAGRTAAGADYVATEIEDEDGSVIAVADLTGGFAPLVTRFSVR